MEQINLIGIIALWLIVGQVVLHYGIPKLKPKWFSDPATRVNKNFFEHLMPKHVVKNQFRILLNELTNLVLGALENLIKVVSSVYQILLYTVLWPIVFIIIKLNLSKFKSKNNLK